MSKRRRAEPAETPGDPDRLRLDRWLWAARFYKTRTLATEAIDGGKVEVNGEKPKRAHGVQPGDALRIRQGPYEFRITVRALAPRRGPPAEARALYEEEEASVARRAEVAGQLKAMAPLFRGDSGKPSKRDRRAIDRLRRRDG